MAHINDVVSSGGTVKRYEVLPDPEELLEYGISLQQLQDAITKNNANVGGNYLVEGDNLLNVRGIGLIGFGLDPSRARKSSLPSTPSTRPTICVPKRDSASRTSARP